MVWNTSYPAPYLQWSRYILAGIFTLSSSLGTIWGDGVSRIYEVYGDGDRGKDGRPQVRSHDRRIWIQILQSNHKGLRISFVPSGPVDFWDKETQVPAWMDKGKVLAHFLKPQVEAETSNSTWSRTVSCRFIVTQEMSRWLQERLQVKKIDRAAKSTLSRSHSGLWWTQIVSVCWHRPWGLGRACSRCKQEDYAASDEVAEWESQRIRYSWKGMTFVIYLNKSLPLKIVYRQVVRSSWSKKAHDRRDECQPCKCQGWRDHSHAAWACQKKVYLRTDLCCAFY